MSNHNTNTNNSGMGCLGWLTVIMVAAKAFDFANYSWLVAFSPAIVAVVLSLLILASMFGLMYWLEDILNWIDRKESS